MAELWVLLCSRGGWTHLLHTWLCNNYIPHSTELACVLNGYMLQEVWKVGVPRRCFRLGRLPDGVPGSTGFSTPLELSNDVYFLWDTTEKLWALLYTETSIEKPYKFVYAHIWLCPTSSACVLWVATALTSSDTSHIKAYPPMGSLGVS